jgi:hypothetical protein
MTTKRKYRRCPVCGVVRPAADFKLVMSRYGPSGPPVCCPACGHVAPRLAFAELGAPTEETGERQS